MTAGRDLARAIKGDDDSGRGIPTLRKSGKRWLLVSMGRRIWLPAEIGYAEVTANQDNITAVTDLTGLTVTVTVPANRRIRISGKARVVTSDAGVRTILWLTLGNDTVIQAARQGHSDGTIAVRARTPFVSRTITPAAGEHTFKLRMQLVGTGTATSVAEAAEPAFIQVEDLGPA